MDDVLVVYIAVGILGLVIGYLMGKQSGGVGRSDTADILDALHRGQPTWTHITGVPDKENDDE